MLLVSVNVSDSSFWYNLGLRLRLLMHTLFIFVFGVSFFVNRMLMDHEHDFHTAGMNVRYFLYFFWMIVYMTIFGVIHYVIYRLHLWRRHERRMTLSRLYLRNT